MYNAMLSLFTKSFDSPCRINLPLAVDCLVISTQLGKQKYNFFYCNAFVLYLVKKVSVLKHLQHPLLRRGCKSIENFFVADFNFVMNRFKVYFQNKNIPSGGFKKSYFNSYFSVNTLAEFLSNWFKTAHEKEADTPTEKLFWKNSCMILSFNFTKKHSVFFEWFYETFQNSPHWLCQLVLPSQKMNTWQNKLIRGRHIHKVPINHYISMYNGEGLATYQSF